MKELDIEKVTVSPAELKLAMQLIEQISEDTYDPTMFEDEEKKRILAAIDEKIAGKHIVAAEPHEPQAGAQVIDLVEALRASLGAQGRSQGQGGAGQGRRPPRPSRRRPRRPRRGRASSAPPRSKKRWLPRRARGRRSDERTHASTVHDPQHPGDAGPFARRHQRSHRLRLRRSEPRPEERIPLHLPGRGAAAHRGRAAGGADLAAQDPGGAAQAARDAAGRAAARPACASPPSATTSRCATAARSGRPIRASW